MCTSRKRNLKDKSFIVSKLPNEQNVYGLYMDSKLLCTPSGIPVTASNPRGLLAMSAELDFSDVLDVTAINLYGMYSTQKEYVVQGECCLDGILYPLLAQDAVLQTASGPEAGYQWKYYPLVIDFLESNNLKHPCFTQFPSDRGRHETWNEDSWSKNYKQIAEFVEKELSAFTPVQSSAFLTAMTFLRSPIISLMLIHGMATPKEAAYLYLMANCIYSKAFPDIKRRVEKKILEQITNNADSVRMYLELF